MTLGGFTVRNFCKSRLIQIFALITFFVLMYGCAQINHLREAQVMFEETATLENAYRLSSGPDGLSTFNNNDSLTQANIRAGYAAVILSLDSLSDDQLAKLKKIRLAGSVYLLQAMSYQRLGKTKEVDDVVAKASKLSDDEIDPRDKAIIAAMDGFTSNSQAFAAISYVDKEEKAGNRLDQNAKNKAYKKVADLLDLAKNRYKTVLDKNQGHHSLRVYLNESILASLNNQLWALVVFDQGLAAADSIKQDIKSTYTSLLTDMCESKDYEPEQVKAKLDYWYNVTAVRPEKKSCD